MELKATTLRLWLYLLGLDVSVLSWFKSSASRAIGYTNLTCTDLALEEFIRGFPGRAGINAYLHGHIDCLESSENQVVWA